MFSFLSPKGTIKKTQGGTLQNNQQCDNYVPQWWVGLVVYYKIQNFLSCLQKIAKSFSKLLNFHVSGSPESVSEQQTQLIIAGHNCHTGHKKSAALDKIKS